MCEEKNQDSVGLGSSPRVSIYNKLPAEADLLEGGPCFEYNFGWFRTKKKQKHETIMPKLGATFLSSVHCSLIIFILLDKDIQDSYCLDSVLGSTRVIRPDKPQSDQKQGCFRSQHEAKLYSFGFFL